MMANSTQPHCVTLTDTIFSPMHKYDCVICERAMDDPQVLSCLHVVCKHCLMYLVYDAQDDVNNNDYSIDCPECKKTVTIGLSGNGIAVSPLNISPTLFFCSLCMKDTNSVFRCQFCHHLFCVGCFREHDYVVCIQATTQTMICFKHNMNIKYYCLKCESMVCIFCLTNEHKDHQHIAISEAHRDMHNHIQKILDNGKIEANKCYATISCLREVLTDLRIKHESARHELRSFLQGFMMLCDKIYDEAVMDLDAIYFHQYRKAKLLVQEIEDFSKAIGNSCKSAKETLTEGYSPVFPDRQPMQSIDAKTSRGDVEKNPFQMVLNDFHEKMELKFDEFAASFGRFKRTPLPINIKSKFGKLGSFIGEFDGPVGFCLDSNDDIVIADKKNHRVQIFNKNGTFKFSFGIPGRSAGYLHFPSKIAVIRKHNRFVVADQGKKRLRLQLFSKNGIFIKKIPSFPCCNIVHAAEIDVTNDGHIVILNKYGSLVVVDEFGEIISAFEFKEYIIESSDIAVNDNEIFICDYKAHCVAVFSITSGAFQGYIGNENELIYYPSGIFVRGDDIFVSYSNSGLFHVARFTRSGLFEALYVCNEMKVFNCHGFKMNSDGEAFALSTGNNCVLIIDKLPFDQKR